MPQRPKGRVTFLIDGFNLYHALPIHRGVRQYRWLDLRALAGRFYSPKRIQQIYYFSAYADWDRQKAARHRVYIQAQREREVEIVLGKFYRRQKKCRARCRQTYWTHEEKQTDVNIAIKLVELAVQDQYDTAVLITGDSDIVPGVEAVKRLYPDKKVHVLIPPGGRAEALKNACDTHRTITSNDLAGSLLPDPVQLPDGRTLTCPTAWK